jgi:hypothetical protein
MVFPSKLADGVPKHVIFQELLPKITFKGDLLAYIAQIPDLEARQKYRSLIGSHSPQRRRGSTISPTIAGSLPFGLGKEVAGHS